MKNTIRFAALATLAWGFPALAQSYTSSPEIAIPDNPGNSIQDTINVSGGPTSISAIGVTLNISHTWDADLDIALVHNGMTLILSVDNGGSGDNYVETRFVDFAATSITAGVAPFTGDFRPQGGATGYAGTIILPPVFLNALSDFNGQDANGAWDLVIDDDAGADLGVLHNWTLDFNPASPPPRGSGAAGGCAVGGLGGLVTFSVTVTPSVNPPSSSLEVSLDASSLGVGAIELFDDGSHGDGGFGDNVFAEVVDLPASIAAGTYSIPFTVSDAEDRSSSGTLTLVVAADPIVNAVTPQGEGTLGVISDSIGANDDRLYRIDICDPGVFYATTYPGTTFDTQLFLFNSDGVAVAMNDDIPDGQPGDATLQSASTTRWSSPPGRTTWASAATTMIRSTPRAARGRRSGPTRPSTSCAAPTVRARATR